MPEYHCLAPDLPGSGLRARTSSFTVKGAADEMAALIRAQARDARAHVVGLSLGAQVGLQLVADHPSVVSSAFLSGPLVLPKVTPLAALEPLLRPLNTLNLSLYAPFRNLAPLVRANMRAANIPERFLEPFKADTNARTVPGLLRTLEEYGKFRVPESLPACAVPMLALATENEPSIIHDSAREIARVAGNARACFVAGAAHTWNLGSPGLFTATLRAWLRDAELPGAVSNLEP
jgi:pimeloyl-ACP methyl ester carboxylesterase